LGVYSLAQRVLMYPLTAVSDVINEVTFPVLALYQRVPAVVRSGFLRATCIVALITFPLMLGIAAVAAPAVHVVFGPRWNELVPLIWILAPVGAFQTVTFTSNNLFMATGRTDLLFRTSAVTSVTVVTGYVVGLQWGLVGVCLAYAIALVLITPLSLWLGFRLVGLRWSEFLLRLLPHVLISGAMFLATLAVVQLTRGWSDEVTLLLAIPTGVLVYGALLLVVRPPALADAYAVVASRRGKPGPD
jgi:PST family polysaccharide transporter